jgi:hypothetical protein
MSPGIFGIQQDYSGSSLGRHLSFKVYDPAKRRTIFSMSQIYDRSVGEDVFVKVTDVDNDGVPELETLTCNGDDCRRTALRKWNGRAYEAAAAK